ncbi:MAG: zinc-finger domain-containing protein [Legionellales bacterium]|nr:zinc-finger domain-containing protein [Legionellales bacterium]
MSEQPLQQACEAKQYTVTSADLPLSCPMPSMALWDAHPKVFLPIAKTGQATCPYCGAVYILKKNEEEEGSPEKYTQQT